MKKLQNHDLFGNVIIEDALLREKFIEPPFSILDTKSGHWQNRKRKWLAKGIKSEVGRDATSFTTAKNSKIYDYMPNVGSDTSVFDPALCEIMYEWFCPEHGNILDPFAGGSVRGLVAHYLGYSYTGIELRLEQVISNRAQSINMLEEINQPDWIIGDSNKILDTIANKFDFIFSCPPYANLEVYSDLDGDISNMNYDNFLIAYESIIKKSCDKLKSGCYACFVVSEVRDKQGNYIGFVPDTINAFKKCGMKYYNEAILLNAIGTAPIRANNCMKNNKLVKVHQNILIFRKGSK